MKEILLELKLTEEKDLDKDSREGHLNRVNTVNKDRNGKAL